MSSDTTEIQVYIHRKGMSQPDRIGLLRAQVARGHLVWSFSFAKDWLKSNEQQLLDPDIEWFPGPQYLTSEKPNFGIFEDSMPDTWGRTLMQKRAALREPEEGESPSRLNGIDYLLGVYDFARMGALRYKLRGDGPFLDNDETMSIPPISSIRELQYGAGLIESDSDSEEIRKWLKKLLAPGSSLGGARPKASVVDEKGHLWIAKFPSRLDTVDQGAWEFLAWQLAKEAGINVADSYAERISGRHNTFFTRRFDRKEGERIHFASAMTMTGHHEAEIRNQTPSYLELAEFIQFKGVNIEMNLAELWRRIIFNIAISNTDDHLRNHAFLFHDEGWNLSPAYDLNPSVDRQGLALNIDLHSNALDFDLARSTGELFQLSTKQMNMIIEEVLESVSTWRQKCTELGIPRVQREMMKGAFRTE